MTQSSDNPPDGKAGEHEKRMAEFRREYISLRDGLLPGLHAGPLRATERPRSGGGRANPAKRLA